MCKIHKFKFSNKLLGRFKMSGKIQPIVRQHFFVMNVHDEKRKVLCEVQALCHSVLIEDG